MKVAKDFPARLELVRRLRDLTFKELAEAAGVTTSTIWRWTNGKGGPHELVLERIRQNLGVDSINYLTGKSNKPPALVVKS